MKEFYADKNGQKRRLRFSVGDIIVCENQNGLHPFMVTVNRNNRNKYGLTYLMCSRPVADVQFSKRELQQLLYSLKPHDVIDRKQFRDHLIGMYPNKKVSNCI